MDSILIIPIELERKEIKSTEDTNTVHYNVKSVPCSRKLRSFEEKENSKQNSNMREINLYDEIYNSSLKTVKSIDSYLKKTKLFTHQLCIKNSLEWNGRQRHKNTTCLLALAYGYWARFAYGYEDEIYVKDFTPYRRYPVRLEFGSKQDDLYLTKLYEELLYYVNDPKEESWAANKWIFNRVLSHLALSNFQNLLVAAQQAAINGIKNGRFPYRITNFNFPFYILIIPEDKNEPLEFHWWVEPAKQDNKIYNELECPFKSK